MATLTHGLETIELGATAWRVILNNNLTSLDVGRVSSGLHTSRPGSFKANRYYYSTDRKILAYDNGSGYTDFSNLVIVDAADTAPGRLDEKIQNSIVADIVNHKIHLSGDAASPGVSKYWGTGGAGTKGFFDLPGASVSPQFGSVTVSGFATVSGLKVKDEDGSHTLQILPSGLTGDRILVIDPENASPTLHIPVRTSEVKFAVTDVLLGRQTAGAGLGELIPLTAAGRSVISGATAAAQKTTLGLGTGASPTFAGLTIGSLAGFLFGTAGAVSAVGSGNKALVAGSIPVVLSDAGPYTISVTDTVMLNLYGSDTSVTLPALGTGRILFFINRAAGSIQSYASSNVVLIGGGAPQGTICAAGAGKWVVLISDSAAWQVIAGN